MPVGTGLGDLETPALVVDEVRLDSNIQRVQAFADSVGSTVRPHVKTHKSLEIARRQIAAGASGLTASKPSEAALFTQCHPQQLILAYPVIDSTRVADLLAAEQVQRVRPRFIVDSAAGVAALAAAAEQAAMQLEVMIKIDVGLGRAGVAPDGAALDELASGLASRGGLTFAGLLSHAGHAYGQSSRDGLLEVALQEEAQLIAAAASLRTAGHTAATLSVGCTPTLLAQILSGAPPSSEVTELRPGNYAFLDLTAVRLGVATLGDLAAFVVATVVSKNADYAIIDAGSKALSTDLGPHGIAATSNYGLAFPANVEPVGASQQDGWPVEKLSEEHGFVRHGGRPLKIGDRVRVYPNHSCSVANLFDRYAVMRAGRVIAYWAVDARGLKT